MTHHEDGYNAGKAAGSWVIDGNTTTEQCAAILKGIEDGDPAVYELEPSPLSGEWAGESIGELIEGYADMPDDGIEQDAACTAYEQGFTEGFWHEVERAARYQIA